jgi:cellulose biosynthesis protein BcsQ
MFTVTFYSFKGGVGRTMALVNVAALLAEAGNRVLLVDFDLEAPGLPSFGGLKGAKGRAGILDYVESYQRELVAPDVSEYIVECPISSDGRSLWLMPAGRSQKPSYSDQLNRMDWEYLYAEQSGYLMFEDLKEQWRQFGGKGFDYVLIDSRTGYTDVGGICTRQLPDSVVIMFMPTAQNIDGLAPIVAGIRAEKDRGREIRIHFCAANVPDEYDEDELVAKLLRSARSKLGYGDSNEEFAEAVVHHRISLALLNDPLIVHTRPKSKLAKEYQQLRDLITSYNLTDPGGAEIALKNILEETKPGLEVR